ncbi:MAG: hypothetical protein IIU71_03610, partial [Selenomonadaceae bacterium]|nr:hypothetical protein [Selenomonadaceae bacterium]
MPQVDGLPFLLLPKNTVGTVHQMGKLKKRILFSMDSELFICDFAYGILDSETGSDWKASGNEECEAAGHKVRACFRKANLFRGKGEFMM